MSDPADDRLDEALSALPREVPPDRDLWPDIRAQIEQNASPHEDAVVRRPVERLQRAGADLGSGRSSGHSPGRSSGVRSRRWRLAPGWAQLAAGVLLVVASSATTYVLTRQSLMEQAMQIAQSARPAPASGATPVSYGFGPERLGTGYLQARAQLDATFHERVAFLPPAARAKLERNLADLRHTAVEISATLAEHPSDPLLQDLLMSTYQQELMLLADINEMTTTAMRTDL